MSWHIENTGTREDVETAIDEAVPNGMPPSVGAYLKDAIAAFAPAPLVGYLISVRSSGHRPPTGAGASEICEVKLVKSGPWKPTR